MTALGPVRLDRSYAACPACGQGSFPADGLLGIDGWLTRRALRMAVRAGVQEPFRRAQGLLEELAGWSVDAETLRRRCHEQAAAARDARADRTTLPEAFAAAGGDCELHIDAGKVFATDKEWHDVKVAVVLKRPRGEPSDSGDFGERELPAPAVRSVVAQAEDRHAFGERVEKEVLRLGVPLSKGLTVLGDGAGWVWDVAEDHFHGAGCVLDYWHAAGYLAAAGRATLGGGKEFDEWLKGAKKKMAADGYDGACEAVGALSVREGLSEAAGLAIGEALSYFAGQAGRMGYAVRLRRGQAVGSGAVEGAIKQLVNLRVKRTAARWDLKGVGPFVELLAMADTPEWDEHWALAG